MGEVSTSLPLPSLEVQRGSGPAFRRFVQRVQGPLLKLAIHILRDPIEAEDVVIEVLARLIPRIDDFESTRHFLSYARTSVRNRAVDHLRSRSFRDSRRALLDTQGLDRRMDEEGPHPSELLPGRDQGVESEIVAIQRRKSIQEAVDSLGEPKRTVVCMFYEQDRTYREIAEELGVSVATVKRHLGSARVTLAARLRDLTKEDHVACPPC